MIDPGGFYEDRLKELTSALTKLDAALMMLGMLRLFVFLALVAAAYLLFGNTPAWLICIIPGLGAFIYLILRHKNLAAERRKVTALLQINSTEMAVLNRKYLQLPDGHVFRNPSHFYSEDIDLFGPGSFFQYCNRSMLEQGREILAGKLTSNNIDGIMEKQEAIRELSEMPVWRQEFSASASMVKVEMTHKEVIQWLNGHIAFVPTMMTFLPLLFTGISIALWSAYLMDLLSGWYPVWWLVLGLGITGRFFQRINVLYANTTKAHNTFVQYEVLIRELGKAVFRSEVLHRMKGDLEQEIKPSSGILNKFSRLLSLLDNRNNPIMGMVLNGLMLWDLYFCLRIEKWMAEHRDKVAGYFEVIASFDAYNSLGNFAFNHPDYTYPVISKNSVAVAATDAGHPLISSKVQVLNSLEIKTSEYYVITGANMAGKSTFLRTLSLLIVMANAGLPVYASAMSYRPVKLISSMRTSDSLANEESYFFSELKRLKFIVDALADDTYFVVLDEILKGTNSTDKAIGSKKFLERLTSSGSTGLIATHDLSLCEVAERNPGVKNFYFDAEVIQNELHFDFKLKEGVCKNMNASFLLKKMNIIP